jgi:hypothetical protein
LPPDLSRRQVVWSPLYVDPWYYSRWERPYYGYDWGWNYGHPWYGYYRGYFTPYSYYASPAHWITDAYIAALLADRYADRVANGAQQKAQAEVAPLNQETKDQIAQQVQEAMETYKSQQPLTLEKTLNTKNIFSVHEEFNAENMETGDEITLAEADLIRLVAVPEPGDQVAVMEVVNSGSEPAHTKFQISVVKLQEMNDKFMQDTEAAMEKMRQEKAAGRLK